MKLARGAVLGMRTSSAVAVIALAAAIVAALGLHLHSTQDAGRLALRDAFARRATLTGRLIGSAFLASNTQQQARALGRGPRRALAATLRAKLAHANVTGLAVLDEHGRVLAAAPAARAGLGLASDVRAAISGGAALSDAYVDRRGRTAFEIAIPFMTPAGRRVVVTSAPVTIVAAFADGFFESAAASSASTGYLLDGAGHVLAARGGPLDPRLAAAARAARTGTIGARTFVSAEVPWSHWRVILTRPTAGLYAPVDGAPRRGAWELFGGFTLAVLALLAVAFAAVRGARRLAAADERAEAAERLAHERLHDPVTGLPSWALFEDRAGHALAAARRHGRPVAVLFVDIDHFARITESLGHRAGDDVLREVAKRISGAARASDTVSRFGGDQYVVLCDDVSDTEALRLVARLQAAFADPIRAGETPVPVTLSIGVAVHADAASAMDADKLVGDATAAMHKAKADGGNRGEIFNGTVHRRALRQLETELALREAIANDGLVLHYQPIVELPSGAPRGVEALVRWQRDETGALVPPDEFIPLAEEGGLIVELGAWVLRTAVREVAGWRRRGLVDDDFRLSVNVSARQLADCSFAQTVTDAVADWPCAPDRLCLEITESAVMADPHAAERMLERLHELGVTLALDDFGVGHSSLGQVARAMPISVLKLDRSFVAAIANPRERAIVEAAAAMAAALKMDAIAEGVETAEQAATLASIGFPLAQGYHFGRPAPAADVAGGLEARTLA